MFGRVGCGRRGRWFRAASGLLLLALWAGGCRRDQGPEGAEGPAPPQLDVASPAPAPVLPVSPASPRGAVLTVVTAVAPGAAAATLDVVGLVRVRVVDEEGRGADLDLPPGGSGILAMDEVGPTGTIWVDLWSPSGQRLGGNTVGIDGLAGSVGILGLELGVSGRRACLRCSTPETLSEVRGLFDTVLLWSASSEVVTGDAAERLHVALRMGLSNPVREGLVHAAGGRIESETADEDAHLVWSVVAPDGAPDVLHVALELARHSEVKALELYEEGRTGRLYERAVPEVVEGTGAGTGVGTGLADP